MSDIKVYNCLNCGAGLKFDPQSQLWKCEYCFEKFDKESLDAYYSKLKNEKNIALEGKEPLADIAAGKEDIIEEKSKRGLGYDYSKELDSYRCGNCGAEIVTDRETVATFCLYCKSPTIIKDRLQGEFRPDLILPFRLTEKEARETYLKYIKRHFLAPKSFKSNTRIEEIRGVYIPFWLFDCENLAVKMTGRGQKIRTWTSGDYIYTETSYYDIERSGNISYNRLPVDASKKTDNEIMERIEPFKYEDIKDFSMEYMSGFLAERYDEERESLFAYAKDRINKYSKDRFTSLVSGYDSFQINYFDCDINDEKLRDKYIMLPIYFVTNIYGDKKIQFALNGQTGLAYGNIPISIKKLVLIFIISFILILATISIGGGLIG